MQYLLSLYEDENRMTSMSEVDMQEMMAAYFSYTAEMRESGAHVAGEPLTPSSDGAIISTQNGNHHVQDGPFTDVKEQLGGFYLIDVANLDEALDWAAKCPCAKTGTIEVRPVWNIGG